MALEGWRKREREKENHASGIVSSSGVASSSSSLSSPCGHPERFRIAPEAIAAQEASRPV